MARTPSGHPVTEIEKSGVVVDDAIARMAGSRICDVVSMSEGNHFMIGMMGAKNAADYLVARLFTDAVFSDDIRSIQLIINRIDGGLPKDVDVARYRTDFGDCLNAVMQMTSDEQTKIDPGDTVMMALCKSLFQIATQDIYWNAEAGMPRRPSDSVKKERDAAMRMVLERTGGRKTLSTVPQDVEEVEIAPWIASLPEKTC